MDKFKDCIIFLLAKAYQKAHGTFKKRLTGYGLTPIQHLILEVLWDEDGLSASTIGERLVLDPATLSGVLERMVSGGWIFKHSRSGRQADPAHLSVREGYFLETQTYQRTGPGQSGMSGRIDHGREGFVEALAERCFVYQINPLCGFI